MELIIIGVGAVILSLVVFAFVRSGNDNNSENITEVDDTFVSFSSFEQLPNENVQTSIKFVKDGRVLKSSIVLGNISTDEDIGSWGIDSFNNTPSFALVDAEGNLSGPRNGILDSTIEWFITPAQRSSAIIELSDGVTTKRFRIILTSRVIG